MRNVGVAIDFSANSKNALHWAIENLIRDGDSVIIIIVQPKGVEPAIHVKTLWANSGSRKYYGKLFLYIFVGTYHASKSFDYLFHIHSAYSICRVQRSKDSKGLCNHYRQPSYYPS